MNYRKDRRSDEEFRRDIKAGSIAEKKILEKWLDIVKKETGKKPEYRDNGCDNSGKYLDDHDVTQAADYEVDGYGLVEVKFSKPLLHNVFHLKVDQVCRILMDKAKILFANGWSTRNKTMFSLITPEDLESAIRNAPQVSWYGFGGKQAYKLRISQFRWHPLR